MLEDKLLAAQANVKTAISTLAPKFGISQIELNMLEPPKVEVIPHSLRHSNLSYERFSNLISVPERDVHDLISISEEASHYLHCQINPQIFRELTALGFRRADPKKNDRKTIDRICHLIDLSELVGSYGRLVFSQEKGLEVPNLLRRMSLHRLRGYYLALNKDLELYQHTLSYHCHFLGYITAQKLFDSYGDRMLSQVARFSEEESKKFIERFAKVSLYERGIHPIIDFIWRIVSPKRPYGRTVEAKIVEL